MFKEISKDGNNSYGIDSVKKAAEAGAIEKLLVADEVIHELREQNKFEVLDKIMKDVDKKKGEVHIISTENEPGKRLQGISGVAAILRFKLEY